MIDTSDRTTAIIVVLLALVFGYFVQLAKQADFAREVIARANEICAEAARPRPLASIISACEAMVEDE